MALNRLKLFGRNKETLRVEKVKITRAVFEGPDTVRVDITLKVEGNNILQLECSPDVLRDIILQGGNAYDAIRPPLATGRYQATWQGMDE
jgi:hypothetical protein